ncbi:hypothetical protein C8J55DRAFT_433660 [Lentinula edodes]|uniref:Uncharacterized protein n=1 Tax=Lentinula lateritia TaxID=40482 RepID=A0A9W9DKJ8_9AGAR|nr:hypothetical protein C8J55DRAFT_433660 [Lentinula edodes]
MYLRNLSISIQSISPKSNPLSVVVSQPNYCQNLPTASPPVIPGKRILIRSALSKSKNRYLSLLNSSSDRVEAFRLELQYFLWEGRVDEAGEEDEDVQRVLRGIELLVKRGSNDYSSGILGQVKYLSGKKTSVDRLLFRREPLQKVSMNIRLQPAVRCIFNPQECILRRFIYLSPCHLPREAGKVLFKERVSNIFRVCNWEFELEDSSNRALKEKDARVCGYTYHGP